MLANQNERHQGFMDLEQRRLDIDEQRNNQLATQIESHLAIANNMTRLLVVIVGKKILKLIRIAKIYKSVRVFKDFC